MLLVSEKKHLQILMMPIKDTYVVTTYGILWYDSLLQHIADHRESLVSPRRLTAASAVAFLCKRQGLSQLSRFYIPWSNQWSDPRLDGKTRRAVKAPIEQEIDVKPKELSASAAEETWQKSDHRKSSPQKETKVMHGPGTWHDHKLIRQIISQSNLQPGGFCIHVWQCLRKRHLMVGKASALAWKTSAKMQEIELLRVQQKLEKRIWNNR